MKKGYLGPEGNYVNWRFRSPHRVPPCTITSHNGGLGVNKPYLFPHSRVHTSKVNLLQKLLPSVCHLRRMRRSVKHNTEQSSSTHKHEAYPGFQGLHQHRLFISLQPPLRGFREMFAYQNLNQSAPPLSYFPLPFRITFNFYLDKFISGLHL